MTKRIRIYSKPRFIASPDGWKYGCLTIPLVGGATEQEALDSYHQHFDDTVIVAHETVDDDEAGFVMWPSQVMIDQAVERLLWPKGRPGCPLEVYQDRPVDWTRAWEAVKNSCK
jgi:hypothetical protein